MDDSAALQAALTRTRDALDRFADELRETRRQLADCRAAMRRLEELNAADAAGRDDGARLQ
jgi:hypothetical protein